MLSTEIVERSVVSTIYWQVELTVKLTGTTCSTDRVTHNSHSNSTTWQDEALDVGIKYRLRVKYPCNNSFSHFIQFQLMSFLLYFYNLLMPAFALCEVIWIPCVLKELQIKLSYFALGLSFYKLYLIVSALLWCLQIVPWHFFLMMDIQV